MFTPGKVYNRRQDLHDRYGGQRQGGISTPRNHPIIMLFTSEAGDAHGYRDVWTGHGTFLYTGEGQYGDMSFVRGNRAVRDHAAEGKELHLFKQVSRGQVQYVGRMTCVGWEERTGLDTDRSQRRIIVFELSPQGAVVK